MKPTHNNETEEFQPLDEQTGSRHCKEVAIVNATVAISDREIMDILNLALNRHKDDQRKDA